MFAERDKHYPSRSKQTSLATAVTNITKPVTKIYFGPSMVFHESHKIPIESVESCPWILDQSRANLRGSFARQGRENAPCLRHPEELIENLCHMSRSYGACSYSPVDNVDVLLVLVDDDGVRRVDVDHVVRVHGRGQLDVGGELGGNSIGI